MAKIVQIAGRNALGEFAPQFAHFNDDVLFGENWNNNDIDVKTRSIITVVALMAQGITDSSLKFHLQNAKDHGVTQKEIAAVITHVGFYAGWPKAWAVFNLAKKVWETGEGDFPYEDGPIVDNPCPRHRLIRKEAATSSKCCPSASLPQPSSAASPESFPRRSREQSTQGAPVNRFSSRICAIGKETV